MSTDALLRPVEKTNWLIAILGVWVVISPYLSGQPDQGSLEFYSVVLPGLAIVLLAGYAIRELRTI